MKKYKSFRAGVLLPTNGVFFFLFSFICSEENCFAGFLVIFLSRDKREKHAEKHCMNKIMDLRFYLLFITILLTAVSSLYVSKTKIKTKEIPTKLFTFVQEHEIIFQHIQGGYRLRKDPKFQVNQVSKVVTARTQIHIHMKFMFRHKFPSL